MNGYIAMYEGRRIEISGEGLAIYPAKRQAIAALKVPRNKEHKVTIMLAEKDGQAVVHTFA